LNIFFHPFFQPDSITDDNIHIHTRENQQSQQDEENESEVSEQPLNSIQTILQQALDDEDNSSKDENESDEDMKLLDQSLLRMYNKTDEYVKIIINRNVVDEVCESHEMLNHSDIMKFKAETANTLNKFLTDKNFAQKKSSTIKHKSSELIVHMNGKYMVILLFNH
jgi:hypothetical protein